jgi:hypothetical protein
MRRKSSQSVDGKIELKLGAEVKSRIQQGRCFADDPFGDRDFVKRGARINAESDREVHSVAATKPPGGKVESLFESLLRLPGAPDKKNPQRADAGLLETICDFTNFARGKSLLQPFEHGIARTLRGDAERTKASGSHRGQELGRGCGGSKVRSVQIDAKLSSRNRFADLQRMSRWRIERRIHEVEIGDSGLSMKLFYLIGDTFGITCPVAPAFDIAVSAVHAFIDTTPLGLNGNRCAVPLVPSKIDPAVKRGGGKRIEVGVFAGRSKMNRSVNRPYNAGNAACFFAPRKRIHQRDTRSFTITCDRVVDSEVAK